MYKNGAILSLVIGAALVFSLAFSDFNKQLNQWDFDEDGNPYRVRILCDSPWNLVVNDTYLQSDPAWHGPRCLPSGRILMIEAGIVAGITLSLAVRGFINGPRPPIRSTRTLPQLEQIEG